MLDPKLAQWLGLPAGGAVDHYRLLGLAPGEGDSGLVEVRVLERMERLRGYQLLQPELVTDGMNRLAQALDCLTDPQARRKYDQSLGLRPTPIAPPVEPPPATPPAVVLPEDAPVLPDEIPLPVFADDEGDDDGKNPRRNRKMEGVLLERGNPALRQGQRRRRAEVKEEIPEALILDEEPEAEPLVLESVGQAPSPRRARVPRLELPTALQRQPVSPPRPARPAAREGNARRLQMRQRVRDRVQLRRLLRIWKRLRDALGMIDRETDRPLGRMELLLSLRELLAAVPQAGHLLGGSEGPGAVATNLARKPSPLEAFAQLTSGQRESLAQDCQAAHYTLTLAYRKVAKVPRQPQGVRKFIQEVPAPVRDPRVIALVVGAWALLVAALRS